ncbi:MAG: hypothetical protein M3277_08075 [Actinomycetota bacterium]|nr:hypothetical protein [Actinomycetota bacterium]
MRATLNAEWLKLRTTRAYAGLIAGAVGVAALGAFSTVASAPVHSLSGPVHSQTFWMLASINIGLFALIVGIRSYTEEFRHRTVVHTLFADPARIRSAIAKAIVAAAAAALLATIAAAGMTLVGLAMASAKGGNLSLAASDVEAFAGFLLATGLWAIVGVGIGALVRHQVPAIVGALVWVLVIENLGAAFLGAAGRYLPGQSAHALAGADLPDLLAPTVGAAVLATYAAVLWMAGAAAMRQRDVA